MTLTIVSGFHRCGSSLLMQMLAAGGMPIVHDPDMGYPSYESNLNLSGLPLEPFDGHAIKWLEPQHAMPPRTPFEIRTIWMTRDHKQQALSAVKFLNAMADTQLTRAHVQQFRRSYDRCEKPSVSLWRRRGPALIQSFEDLLTNRARSIEAIVQFLDVDLDIRAMVRQIRTRDAKCLPNLLEMDLINDGPPADFAEVEA